MLVVVIDSGLEGILYQLLLQVLNLSWFESFRGLSAKLRESVAILGE